MRAGPSKGSALLVCGLSPGKFDLEAALFEFSLKKGALVPLNLNRSILDGSTGPTALLQGLAQEFQFTRWERYAGDDRHALAVAAFGFPANTNDSIPFGSRCRFLDLAARASLLRAATVRTDPANACGKDHALALILLQRRSSCVNGAVS